MKYFLLFAASIILLPFFSRAATIEELLAKLAELQRQLQMLQSRGATPAQTTPFSKTLRTGSRGNEVKNLQSFLKSIPGIYPEGIVSGYFGSLTRMAVIRFQERHGIDPVGIVGPKTRAKINGLIEAAKEKEVEPSQTPAASTPEPLPAPATPPAASAPSTPATTTPPAPPTPAYVPSSNELGQPLSTSLAWTATELKYEFTHAPGAYAKSYKIYLSEPDKTGETAFGPYTLLEINKSSSSNGVTFTRLGLTGWQWRKKADLAGAAAEGTYGARVVALGDGGAESASSPGLIATLYSPIEFDALHEGSPLRAVLNSTVTSYPLTIRLSNSYRDLYYKYSLWDGGTLVWESGILNQAGSSKIQSTFSNANNYRFSTTTAYNLRAESFDNLSGLDSTVKQKSGSLEIKFSL